MKTIYLAGPISGDSYDKVMERIEMRAAPLKQYYEILSPMTGKGYLRGVEEFHSKAYPNPVSTTRAIAGRDKWMVRQADIVFADLTGSDMVSIGTMFEIAWAHLLGKLVIVTMEENNIHDHAFVTESADLIFETQDEALIFLMKLASGVA